MKRFELFEPTSLEEAVGLLSDFGDRGRVLAGGTDLLLKIKRGEVEPSALVSLRKIPGLAHIREEDGFLELGASTTHRAIEKSSRVRTVFPALSDAVDNLGSIQIRNIATVGGNICNGAPSADTVPPLLVHDAKLKIFGLKGTRELPLAKFFLGPGKTRMDSKEILEEIVLPLPPQRTSSVYIKLSRRSSMELPLVGVAVRITFNSEGIVLAGRIALSCAGPFCFRAMEAEALLPGKRLEKEVLKAIGFEVLKEAKPRDSFRCSAGYRKAVIPVLVERAMQQCYERCFTGEGRNR